MKPKIYWLTATLLAGMFFCSVAVAQKITYDILPGTDFSKYKTYKWERAENAKYPTQEIDNMLTRIVDAELAKKGLTRVNVEPCDLYLSYQFSILQDIEYSSFRTEVGWQTPGAYGIPGFVGAGANTNSSVVIKKGALVLEMYDVAQKKRVWETYVTKTLSPSNDLNKNEKNTRKVLAKVLKNYPPPAK